MNALEKWMILTPLQKLPYTVGDLSNIIVASGFEIVAQSEKITQSGHTEPIQQFWNTLNI